MNSKKRSGLEIHSVDIEVLNVTKFRSCIINACIFLIAYTVGNFGTSVGSYFRLLRWLCVLNFGLFTLTFTLIVVPQVRKSQNCLYV